MTRKTRISGRLRIGGFMTTLAVQAGWWLREVFRMVLSAAPEGGEDPETARC